MAVDKDAAPEKDTKPGKEVTLRRVYALPAEMVDRIGDFQRDKGFTSEVEAVRKLLDEALKNRDSLDDVINRFMSRLRSLRLAAEVAKDVLVGHPIVSTIRFVPNGVSFETKSGFTVTISDQGSVEIEDDGRNPQYWHTVEGQDRFGAGFSSFMKPKSERRPSAAPAFEGGMDDDIPF